MEFVTLGGCKESSPEGRRCITEVQVLLTLVAALSSVVLASLYLLGLVRLGRLLKRLRETIRTWQQSGAD